MPTDISPVVTRRQSAMSSLRANATIIVLRVLPRPSYPTFASNNDDTTNAGPKIVSRDMDRPHLLHFVQGRTQDSAKGKDPG
jgi:hypothetical protein